MREEGRGGGGREGDGRGGKEEERYPQYSCRIYDIVFTMHITKIEYQHTTNPE